MPTGKPGPSGAAGMLLGQQYDASDAGGGGGLRDADGVKLLALGFSLNS